MPVISMFYGIIVSMFYLDTKKHKAPHIHVSYQGKEAVIAIPSIEDQLVGLLLDKMVNTLLLDSTRR